MAGKFPLDLSKFKKISSDHKSTTLRHPDGHEVRIAHNALSPKMRSSLHELALADGGEVADKKENTKDSNTIGGIINYPGAEKQAPEPTPTPKRYAEGTPDEPVQPDAQTPQSPVTINIGGGQPQIPQALVNPAPGSMQAPPAVETMTPTQQVAARPENLPFGVTPEAATPPPATAPQASIESPISPSAASISPNGDVNRVPATQSDPYGTEAYGVNYTKGVEEQKKGISQLAEAEGAQGQAEAQQLSNAIPLQQQAVKTYQDHFSELENERKAFQQDLQNQHIDPRHYLNSMGTGARISSAIGLILGGIGGGLLGQENPALKFLNDQINRDVDAQKAELGKKENLLNANMKQFGNLRDATDMTRVQQMDIVSNQLKQQAALAKDPVAKARALEAAGQLDMQAAPVMGQLALRKTLMGALGSAQQDPTQVGNMINAMRQLNPEMAKSLEQRYVPGVGLAQVPVPEKIREEIVAKQTFQKMAADFFKWASQNSGAVDPRVVNQGRTKAAELQSLYRNAINGGVFKKGEQEFIDNIIDSDPTKFFNQLRVLPKIQEVIRSSRGQLNTLKQGYGLPVPAPIQESAPRIK